VDIESAFAEAYERTYRSTLKYITLKCRCTADIGDIAQEVYLELYGIMCRRGAGYVKYPERLVRRLTKQQLFRYYRRREAIREVQNAVFEDGNEAEIADIEAISAEETVCDSDVIERTELLLKAKSETVRKVFHLYYRFGMTVPEIADALKLSESDVKNKLYRTLKEIREYWRNN